VIDRAKLKFAHLVAFHIRKKQRKNRISPESFRVLHEVVDQIHGTRCGKRGHGEAHNAVAAAEMACSAISCTENLLHRELAAQMDIIFDKVSFDKASSISNYHLVSMDNFGGFRFLNVELRFSGACPTSARLAVNPKV